MRDETIALGSQAVAGGSAAAATVASSLGLTWLAVAAAIVGAVAALHFEPEHVPARVPRLIFGVLATGVAAALVAVAAPHFPGFGWSGEVPIEARAGLLGLSLRYLIDWGKRLTGATPRKAEG